MQQFEREDSVKFQMKSESLDDVIKVMEICENFVDDESGFPLFPVYNWQLIKSTFSEEAIRDGIAKYLVENEIHFPLKKFTLSNLKKLFVELKNRSVNDYKISHKTETRYQYRSIDKVGWTISDKLNKYDMLSNCIQEKNRMITNTKGNSYFYEWERGRVRSLSSGLFYKEPKAITYGRYRYNIGKKCGASQFRVAYAKYIIEKFNAYKVLDPCGGWGDRLMGALIANGVVNYTVIDPNKDVIDGYYKEIEMYSDLIEPEKKINIINDCAEKVDFDTKVGKDFDLVLTSPPYHTAELYQNDKNDNQSHIMYPELIDFKTKFLFPMLEKCFNSLRRGGTMLINISDYIDRDSKQRVEICDDMVDFLKSIGLKFNGTIGYPLNFNSANYESSPDSFPNIDSECAEELKTRKRIFVEPVWHFSKT